MEFYDISESVGLVIQSTRKRMSLRRFSKLERLIFSVPHLTFTAKITSNYA